MKFRCVITTYLIDTYLTLQSSSLKFNAVSEWWDEYIKCVTHLVWLLLKLTS